MILELLKYHYISESTGETSLKVRQTLDKAQRGDADTMAVLAENQVDVGDLRTALEGIAAAQVELAKPRIEEATLFARDPYTSLLQTVLQRYFLEHNLVLHPPAAGALHVTAPISDVTLAPGVAVKAPHQLFGKMSQSDIRWIACLAAKAYRAIGKRRSFPNRPAPPRKIASDARVFLVADWGSGVSRARKIAERIRSMLTAETTREQHVVHLGDVYYSGWPEEYDDHFLKYWPVRPGEETRYGSWCLNANHDMFSGGHGYFDFLLKDARFKDQGQCSFFSLETGDWQLLGLDSAWEDENLAGDQVDWVRQRQTAHPEKKLVLMTHHQPYSAFEKECTNLQVLTAQNKVTAWFWGHEHLFAAYKPRTELKYGRLIGHGGVPVWARLSKPVSASVQYVSSGSFRSAFEKFALFGFAVLDFAGEKIGVRYFDEHGTVEFTETLE